MAFPFAAIPGIIGGVGALASLFGLGKNKEVGYTEVNPAGSRYNQWLMDYIRGKVGQQRNIAPINPMMDLAMSQVMGRYGGGAPWTPPGPGMSNMGGGMPPGGRMPPGMRPPMPMPMGPGMGMGRGRMMGGGMGPGAGMMPMGPGLPQMSPAGMPMPPGRGMPLAI